MVAKEIFFWDELLLNLPVCQELENNWKSIRDEYLAYEEKCNTERGTNKFQVFPSPNVRMANAKYGQDDQADENLYTGVWSSFPAGTQPAEMEDFRQWGHTEKVKKYLKWKTKSNLSEILDYSKKQFSTFNSIVEKYADSGQCSGAMFSIVEPGAVINPHYGSDKLMRAHLCLVNDLRCTITVGQETRSWTEGKILAFKDGIPHKHSVRHEGESKRINLMFDFDIEYLRKKFPGAIGL